MLMLFKLVMGFNFYRYTRLFTILPTTMIFKHSKYVYNSVPFFWRSFPFRYCSRKMSDSSEVIFNEISNKGIVTLNRPKALNALNLNMIRLMYPKLKEWESKKALVIMKGSGEKAFCAGGDVRSVTEAGKKGEPLTREFFYEEYLLNCLIGTYHIPYIALIDGITMGGGVGLSVHGQYRIATERSLFAMPETAIGLFPDVGGSYFLPRLGGNLGMFLALTGHRLKGRDVLRAGVATHVCDSSKLSELEEALTSMESTYQEDVTSIIKKFCDASAFGKDTEFSLKPYMSKIQKCFSGNSVEDILRNLEEDGTEWAKKQLEILSKMSPTSVKVTFEALKRGEQMTLQECLSMEYRLSQRFCEDHDFYEGVRAVLIDKDNTTKWKPSSFSEITPNIIERYFSSLPPERELVF